MSTFAQIHWSPFQKFLSNDNTTLRTIHFCTGTSFSLFSLSFLSLLITLCSQLFSSVCPWSAITYLGCEGQPRAAVIWQPQAQSAHCVWPAAGVAEECAHTIKSITPSQPPEGEQTWAAVRTVALQCRKPQIQGPTFTFRFTTESITLNLSHCDRMFSNVRFSTDRLPNTLCNICSADV